MSEKSTDPTPQAGSEKIVENPTDKSKPPLWIRLSACTLGWALGTAGVVVSQNIITSGNSDTPPPATAAATAATEMTPTETMTAQQTKPQQSFTLPDFRPVIITDPSTTAEHVTDVSKRSQEQLKKAVGTLATTMSVPESNVLEPVTMVMPNAPIDQKTGKPCFPHEEIREIVENAPYLNNAVSYVILPPNMCEGQPWDAYAYSHSKIIVTKTSPRTINTGVIMHEAAHTFGLDHTRRLRINYPDTDPASGWYDIKPEHYDIIEDLENGRGYLSRLQNGNVDPGGGRNTVTGYHYSIEEWCTQNNTCSHALNFVERNRLDPEKFPIRDIDPAMLPDNPVNLTISPEPHNVSGIRIPVPANHPIRQIQGCESITHIIVGIDHVYYSLIDGAPGFATTIIASDKDGNLIEVDAPRSDGLDYSPSTKNILEKEQWHYLYNDSVTGVSVAARLVNGQTELRVTTFTR